MTADLLTRSPFDVARERRLVIIADWIPPDFGAVGQYMQMRARALAGLGHDVTLVGLSSTENSTRHEMIGKGSLTEVRLLTSAVPRASLVTRLLWTIWTNLRLVWASFGALRRADGILFTGSMLIEVIFSLDGIGLLGFEAALNRDYPVMFGTLYFFGLLGLLIGLLGDVLYTVIDPRIDFEARS